MIEAAGALLGGIGVSGAPGGKEDDACAAAGIAAIRDSLEASVGTEEVNTRASSPVIAAAVVMAAAYGKPKEPPPDIIKSQRQVMDKAKVWAYYLDKSADERRDQSDGQK